MTQPAVALRRPDPPGPVESRTLILIDRYGVTIRWISSGIAAIFCLLSPRLSMWQIPICLIVIGWSVLRLTQRRRPTTTALLCADLAVACFVGLTTALTTSATAVLNLAGLGVNVANPASLTFAWQPRRWLAAVLCCIVIACYLLGHPWWTGSGHPGPHPPFTCCPFRLRYPGPWSRSSCRPHESPTGRRRQVAGRGRTRCGHRAPGGRTRALGDSA